MTKRTRIRRRQFLAASGMALAHTAIAGRVTSAAPAEPPAPPDPPIPPRRPLTPPGLAHKPGAAPGYIISGRGEDLLNPYFHPVGEPSNQTSGRPLPASGNGVGE